MSPIHPNLLEEIYYDKFLPIHFKCWTWLKQVVCYNECLRDRGAPPYREGFYLGEVDEPLFDPQDASFRFPWCEDRHLQKKFIYYVDWLYYETFRSKDFKVVDAGREFPSVKVVIRPEKLRYPELRRSCWGLQVGVERADGEVFEQYYWDSFWKSNRTLLIGPLSLCDHSPKSPFKFTDKMGTPPGRDLIDIGIPQYRGSDYDIDLAACLASTHQTMWTLPGKGVNLWTNTHSINDRLREGYEVKIQYEGLRSEPSFVNLNDRLVCNWEDERYYGDLTCQSPDIYKYIRK
jgi:hypothetical protein